MDDAGQVRFDFTGRVALIVGANGGIGAETARAFAAAGASVVLAARSLDRLRTLADDLGAGGLGEGVRVVPIRADVTDPDSVESMVATAVHEFGRVDYAFNNAAETPTPTPLADMDIDTFNSGLDASTGGTFLSMRSQIPAMLASGGGAIVNMASTAGVHGVADLGAYVAGKAGIIGLTKVAALEYADQGIRVNAVAPGPIRTERIVAAGTGAQQAAAAAVPMRRLGEPADVSDVVLWLCSSGSSFVTGAVLPIDGGQLAGNKPSRRAPGQVTSRQKVG